MRTEPCARCGAKMMAPVFGPYYDKCPVCLTQIAEDKIPDWTTLCGVCGNEQKHELHRSKAAPPKDYAQSPHAFIRAEEP